ncbi:hypothetical protein JKF63_03613 [Porcisia hertigi]|uniref:J domain-containing protein n=1 Tax=Porcisia hertigi TaxID=2761500 RepID=A0A836HWN5_9TRYP|nr:hypothetical protein JKF63_03613 [Porcisia hertigi]
MRPSILSSSCGVDSATTVDPSAVLRDPAGATDAEIVECLLLLWRDVSAAFSLYNGTNHPAMVRRAAFNILGGDSLQNAATLKRRYRQLAIRVHPDKNASPQAPEAFQVLQTCFEYAIESCELGANNRVEEQAVFQRTDDPSLWEKGGSAFKRGAAAGGGDARSHFFSSSSSSSALSASSTSRSPPLSPFFRTGGGSGSSSSSSSSSSVSLEAHPGADAAGIAPGLRSCALSDCSAPAGASLHKSAFSSSTEPDPPNVFVTTGGAATVPAPNVFDEKGSSPAAPPPPVFDANATFESIAAEPSTHCVGGRASTGDCTSFTGSFGPAPPIVFGRVSLRPLTTRAGGMVAGTAEVARQRASDRQRGSQETELPTLAELLARLDAVDDEEHDIPVKTAKWARGPSPRGGANGSALRGRRRDETAATTPSGSHAKPSSQRTHSTMFCSQRYASNSDDHDGGGAPSNRHASMTPVPVQVNVWSGTAAIGAPLVTASTLGSFSSALREEVSRTHCHRRPPTGFLPHMSSSPLAQPSVRSRRVGGGGVGGTNGGATGNRGTFNCEGERCACGKAPRGRCFLCEE